ILSRFYQQNLETASHNVSKYPLQIVFYQQFDDLYTFQGRPVTDIVSTDPERKRPTIVTARELMNAQIVPFQVRRQSLTTLGFIQLGDAQTRSSKACQRLIHTNRAVTKPAERHALTKENRHPCHLTMHP